MIIEGKWGEVYKRIILNPQNFEKEVSHAKRVTEADISHPIEIYYHQDQWIILDGVHRFTKIVQLGYKTIKVRKVSSEIAQLVKRT